MIRQHGTNQINGERKGGGKLRQWPKGKIFGVICLLFIVVTAYGIWRYYLTPKSREPVTSLSIEDIEQFRGKVIVIHFMYLDCSGRISPRNEHQLKQLKIVCNNFCGKTPVTMITVAIACSNANFAEIRTKYGITWLFGDDLADGKIDVFNAYKAYSIDDGTVILIDKEFNVAQVYNEAISADTVSLKINQLLEQ